MNTSLFLSTLSAGDKGLLITVLMFAKSFQSVSAELILPPIPPFSKDFVALDFVVLVTLITSAAAPTCLLEVLDEAHHLDFIILFFGGINSFILFWSKFFLTYVRSDLFIEVRVPNAQFRILSSSSSNINFNKSIYTTTYSLFLCA